MGSEVGVAVLGGWVGEAVAVTFIWIGVGEEAGWVTASGDGTAISVGDGTVQPDTKPSIQTIRKN